MQGTNFELVGDFMQAMGQDVNNVPGFPDKAILELRADLIAEETEEVLEAIRNMDLPNVAKELTDLLYVVYGAGHALGIDLDACFEEVHGSNMSKLGPDGKPIYREDGKVLKGPNYKKANIENVLELD